MRSTLLEHLLIHADDRSFVHIDNIHAKHHIGMFMNDVAHERRRTELLHQHTKRHDQANAELKSYTVFPMERGKIQIIADICPITHAFFANDVHRQLMKMVFVPDQNITPNSIASGVPQKDMPNTVCVVSTTGATAAKDITTVMITHKLDTSVVPSLCENKTGLHIVAVIALTDMTEPVVVNTISTGYCLFSPTMKKNEMHSYYVPAWDGESPVDNQHSGSEDESSCPTYLRAVVLHEAVLSYGTRFGGAYEVETGENIMPRVSEKFKSTMSYVLPGDTETLMFIPSSVRTMSRVYSNNMDQVMVQTPPLKSTYNIV